MRSPTSMVRTTRILMVDPARPPSGLTSADERMGSALGCAFSHTRLRRRGVLQEQLFVCDAIEGQEDLCFGATEEDEGRPLGRKRHSWYCVDLSGAFCEGLV